VKTALILVVVVGIASIATAQPVDLRAIRHVSFAPDDPDATELIEAIREDHGASVAAGEAMCACLLDAHTIAESQGRLDFSVVAETSRDREPIDVTAHVRIGPQYSVGRIQFTGHGTINDSTLRRAFTLRERELLDVGKLRQSLERLNDIGLAEAVTLRDLVFSRHVDGATADITVPLRKRGWRSWSVSGPVIPGLGSYRASISSRLPVWGRGAFDASTYLVTFNALALARSSLGILSVLSRTPPAVVLFERPYVPGQGSLSGFAWSPALSVRETIAQYGRAHLGPGAHAILDDEPRDTLAVPIVGEGHPSGAFFVCASAQSRWRWLRRGAVRAIDIALATALP
jgi:hypothetical protein